MASSNSDDGEVFEINDFSTSSDWERFVADLEEILTQWNLLSSASVPSTSNTNVDKLATTSPVTPPGLSSKSSLKHFAKNHFNDQQHSLWTQKNENLKFGKVSFMLSYFCFKPIVVAGSSVDNVAKSSKLSPTSTKITSNRSWNDMQSVENDWPASGHPLVRYYGLSQFLLLTPLNSETISTEDRIKHLLGSASIALNNIECEIPFFCQICQPNRRLFAGIQNSTNGFRTYFDMIQFGQVPNSFQFVSELIVLFKKKLYSSFSYSSTLQRGNKHSDDHQDHRLSLTSPQQPSGKIQMSIRFTFILNRWPPQYLLFNSSAANHPALDHFSYFDSNFDPRDLTRKPVVLQQSSTINRDPIKQLQLATTWPSVAEELIVDNAYHSDLQPRNAPRWSLRALFSAAGGQTSGGTQTVQFLRDFIKLKQSKSLLCTYLDTSGASSFSATDDNCNDSDDVRSALDRLTTSSNLPFTSNLSAATTGAKLLGQMMQNLQLGTQITSGVYTTSQLNDIVQFVFDPKPLESSEKLDPLHRKCMENLKSSPVDSLSWRISLLVANVYHRSRNLSSVAPIWKLFVDELRSYWQRAELLPLTSKLSTNIENDDDKPKGMIQIDYGNCLFHQKLEMLNCCIYQKIKRERSITIGSSADDNLVEDSKNLTSSIIQEDEEEEFFDCDDQDEDDQDVVTSTTGLEASKPCHLLKPEGRLEKFYDPRGNLQFLLDHPTEPIYIPVTQDPAPMTEDILIRQMSALAHMNASGAEEQEEGGVSEDFLVKQSAHFQSAGLMSDMEAFKAANLGATFEDFIRWHSPRDWIELDVESDGVGSTISTSTGSCSSSSTKKYGLSRRMAESNCSTWHELWSQARPYPVQRQKRLFNYTKEAEEILRSFEMTSVDFLVGQMVPIVTKSVLGQILQYRQEIIGLTSGNSTTSKDQKTKSFQEQPEVPPKLLTLDIGLIESMFARLEFESICDQLSQIEYQSLCFYSLLKKFCLSYESEYKKPFKIFYRNNGNSDSVSTSDNENSKSSQANRPSRLGQSNRTHGSGYSTPIIDQSKLLEFITGLLLEPEVEFVNTDSMTELVVRLFADGDRFRYEQSTSVGDRLPLSGPFYEEDSIGDQLEDDEDQDDRSNQQGSGARPSKSYQLPPPTGKEFIFRASAIARPAPYSRPSPHRMYCLLSPGKDFRIASAFSEDTAYF